MRDLDTASGLNLQDYVQIARRRHWWLILPLFLSWALVMVGSLFITPRYRSETVIIVDQQKVPEQYVIPNVANDLQQRLQSMTQQILSRTRLLGIISSFHLYSKKDEKPVDPDSLVKIMRDDIKIDLVQTPGRPWELSAFKISYSAPTAKLAQQITNELSSLFIAENLRNRQQLSENTTQFLENQLEAARKTLADQEDRLRDFKSQYLGELPEQVQTNIQILSGLQSRLQAATEALDQANQQRLYLESLLNQYKTFRTQFATQRGDSVASPIALDEQLDKLRAQLADLSVRDTPQHPDVVRIKHQIAVTEKLKEEVEAKKQTSGPEGSELGPAKSLSDLQVISPMLQIEGQVKSNRLEIENRKQEVRNLEQQIEVYQTHLNLTPVREQQLAAITRDHEQSRTNYESLLNKKMQSEMATNLEKRQEGEQFRIIDPPNLPHRPYSPDRFKLSLLGVVIGLVLSIGFTTFVENTDERIYSDDDLQSVTPVPVLITVPLLQTAFEQQQSLWHRRLEFMTASLLITVMPLVTAYSYFRG